LRHNDAHVMNATNGPKYGVSPSWGERLVGIEGLRAVAATSIVALHVWIEGSPDGQHQLGPLAGSVGVNLGAGLTLFFALSGFLLYRPFVVAIAGGGRRPSTSRFLRRRALRILPAYWIVLLVSALLLASTRTTWESFGALTDPQRLLQSLLLLQNYTPHSIHTGIGPAWSLAVEAVFYLLLPALAHLGARAARGHDRRGRLRAMLVPPALLLVIGIAGKAWDVATDPSFTGPQHAPTWHEVLARSFICNADLFAFGMCAAVGVVAVGQADARRLRRAALIGAGMVAATTFVLHARDVIDDRPFNTLSALASGLLVLAVALPGRRIRVLEARPLVFLGVVSYSVFLWHEPVTVWLTEHGVARGGPWGVPLNMVVVYAVTVLLATITYRLVEAPAMGRTRLPDRLAPEPPTMQAAP
jgi:peptidoglycan/LPS O-acetylase OafA/YrhL